MVGNFSPLQLNLDSAYFSNCWIFFLLMNVNGKLILRKGIRSFRKLRKTRMNGQNIQEISISQVWMPTWPSSSFRVVVLASAAVLHCEQNMCWSQLMK